MSGVVIDMRSKIYIWSNSDLDGACSVILLGQVFKEFEYQGVFFGNFQERYLKWADKNLDNYDKVFIIGMVVDQSFLNKIDDPRVVIISDRGEDLNSYESTLFIEKTTSCSKFIYQKFRKLHDFSVDVQKLTCYVDDYNDYKLKYKESEYLNAIYRTMGYKKFYSFVNRFWDGYNGLTDTEIALAEGFFEEIEKEIQTLDLYSGNFKDLSVLATFTNLSVNEIAKKMLDNYDQDVIVVVNPDTKFVSFRKREGSPADIAFMAEILCGGGGGEYASGGNITDKFLDFTQKMILL